MIPHCSFGWEKECYDNGAACLGPQRKGNMAVAASHRVPKVEINGVSGEERALDRNLKDRFLSLSRQLLGT